METSNETTAVSAPHATLMDRTVCLSVNKRKFGNRRKASLALVETPADKALLSLSKRLIESAELKAINAVDAELRTFLDGVCMPSMFKAGVYMLAIPLVEMVDNELRKFQAKRAAAVEVFVAAYPEQVRAIEARLDNQYDARNYPTVEDMRDLFSFDWQYVSFGVPGSLKAIKASLFDDERAKYAELMKSAATEYRNTLRARLLGFVDVLRESLSPSSDGKKRRVYDTHVEKVTAALRLFEMQDATDDDQLGAVVTQLRAVMTGVDVGTLRDDDAFRARIESGLAEVVSSLKTIVVDRDTREIEFEDEA